MSPFQSCNRRSGSPIAAISSTVLERQSWLLQVPRDHGHQRGSLHISGADRTALSCPSPTWAIRPDKLGLHEAYVPAALPLQDVLALGFGNALAVVLNGEEAWCLPLGSSKLNLQ